MSLNVPQSLLWEVRQGQKINDATFIRVIHDSLHDAFHIISDLAKKLEAYPDANHATHAPPSMDDSTRGQLLRLMASDAIRGAVERQFGIRLAFQNCHKVAAFRPEAVGGPAWQAFTSIEAQVLNQAPESRDC